MHSREGIQRRHLETGIQRKAFQGGHLEKGKESIPGEDIQGRASRKEHRERQYIQIMVVLQPSPQLLLFHLGSLVLGSLNRLLICIPSDIVYHRRNHDRQYISDRRKCAIVPSWQCTVPRGTELLKRACKRAGAESRGEAGSRCCTLNFGAVFLGRVHQECRCLTVERVGGVGVHQQLRKKRLEDVKQL